jgi:hypothetical protein
MNNFEEITGVKPQQATNTSWPAANRSTLVRNLKATVALTDEMLPAGWAKWVRETSDSTNSPIGYTALGLITAAAAAIGNARVAIVKPNWVEACVLNGMLIGPPSTRKTASQRPFRDALVRIETEERGQWYKSVETQFSGLPEKERKKVTRPPMPRLTVHDTTIEALAEKSADNPRGLYVYFDELASWFGSFGRYGSVEADRSFFIASYDASYHIRDRMKNPGKDPIIVPRLSLCICGAMVPDKLERLFYNDEDDGLTSRFLYDWSEPLPTRSLLVNSESEATSAERFSTLEKVLVKLRALEFGQDGERRDVPRGYRLTDDALAEFDPTYLKIAGVTTNSRGHAAGWYGKAAGRIARIALVYEYLGWAITRIEFDGWLPEPTEIGVDAIRRATAYSRYAAGMFARAATGGESGKSYDDAADLVDYLIKNGVSSFGPTAIGQKAGFSYLRGETPGAKLRKANVLRLLEDLGFIWLKEFDTQRGEVKKYLVNPNLF